MPLVVDASIAACWAFRDEDHPIADLALERLRTDQGIAPSLWWFEIRNILVVNERRNRLSVTDSTVFLRDLARLGLALDRDPQDGELLRLARAYRLTAYDAAYLELALRTGAVLSTLDADLARAARAEAVPLLGDIAQG